tara:strand:+ start:525 stop:1127 length:603 start_codon:yes stop_codon:yes gene_type:complete
MWHLKQSKHNFRILLDNPNQPASCKLIMFKEIINTDIPLRFYLGVQTNKSNNIKVMGDAYNPTEEKSDQIPYIEINIHDNGDKRNRSIITPKLANALRHEIEHLTQSGYNTLPGKYLPDDQKYRDMSQMMEYLMLPKEQTAGVHGIYSESKKSKRDFYEVLQEYLTNLYLLESDIKFISKIYLLKAKELSLWKIQLYKKK